MKYPKWAKRGWYDVTDPEFGAIGDGEADDTVAIQRAVDACATHGGGTVFGWSKKEFEDFVRHYVDLAINRTWGLRRG